MTNTQHAIKQKNTKTLVLSVPLLAVTLSVLLLFFMDPSSEGRTHDQGTSPGPRTAAEAARGAAPRAARLLRQLGQARVGTHAETGELISLSAPAGDTISRPYAVAPNARPETAARGYMARYGSLFGIEDQKSALRTEGTERAYEGDGRSVVSFRQVYKGVPVMAGELNVEVDGENNLLVANGEALPDISLDIRPDVSAKDARQTALQTVAKDNDLRRTRLQTSKPELWIYDPRLMGGPGVEVPRLVWRMNVADKGRFIDELVLVDAHGGDVALNFDQTEKGLVRKTYTAQDYAFILLPGFLVCDEFDPVCYNGDLDAKNAHFFAKDTYDFYKQHHDRNGIDGADMPILSTVHGCNPYWPCPMHNAFWNGKQAVFGKGWSLADDVVGHEITHGVTQYESHLFYYYQSGAINESLSDTWGEWMDQTNGKGTDGASVRWELGEDLPDGPVRDMSDPTLYNSPDRMTSPLYHGSSSDKGGVHTNSGVGNKAAFLITEGGTFNGHTVTKLGIDKASQVYYKAQRDLLRSGSDYMDLGLALSSACKTLKGQVLVGTTAKITTFDCQQVQEAVAATEMMKQPPVAQAPEVPMCDTGTTRVEPSIFYDDMEQNYKSSNWKIEPDTWVYDGQYTTNGTWALHASDPPTKADFSLTKELPVPVPTGKKTFLRFDHAYQFDTHGGYADGGLLEFRFHDSSWKDAGPLFTNGSGYDGTLASGVGNPLGGHKAFVGSSHGYRSSRLDLSSLGGKDVYFRFRTVSNPADGDLGWYLDNLRIYSCA